MQHTNTAKTISRKDGDIINGIYTYQESGSHAYMDDDSYSPYNYKYDKLLIDDHVLSQQTIYQVERWIREHDKMLSDAEVFKADICDFTELCACAGVDTINHLFY